MAEIEYFVDPEKKSIDKFSKVAATRCMLLSKERQVNGEPAIAMTLKEAMDQVRIFCLILLYTPSFLKKTKFCIKL